jgi:hypothetical protein
MLQIKRENFRLYTNEDPLNVHKAGKIEEVG